MLSSSLEAAASGAHRTISSSPSGNEKSGILASCWRENPASVDQGCTTKTAHCSECAEQHPLACCALATAHACGPVAERCKQAQRVSQKCGPPQSHLPSLKGLEHEANVCSSGFDALLLPLGVVAVVTQLVVHCRLASKLKHLIPGQLEEDLAGLPQHLPPLGVAELTHGQRACPSGLKWCAESCHSPVPKYRGAPPGEGAITPWTAFGVTPAALKCLSVYSDP